MTVELRQSSGGGNELQGVVGLDAVRLDRPREGVLRVEEALVGGDGEVDGPSSTATRVRDPPSGVPVSDTWPARSTAKALMVELPAFPPNRVSPVPTSQQRAAWPSCVPAVMVSRLPSARSR